MAHVRVSGNPSGQLLILAEYPGGNVMLGNTGSTANRQTNRDLIQVAEIHRQFRKKKRKMACKKRNSTFHDRATPGDSGVAKNL